MVILHIKAQTKINSLEHNGIPVGYWQFTTHLLYKQLHLGYYYIILLKVLLCIVHHPYFQNINQKPDFKFILLSPVYSTVTIILPHIGIIHKKIC